MLFILSFVLGVSLVNAHGFLAIPAPRNYKADISYGIDNLRNPLRTPNMCRGLKPSGVSTAITLKSNSLFTVQLGLSVGAEHTGTCSLELFNQAGTKSIVLAKDIASCTAGLVHGKSSSSKSLCPTNFPTGLVTNDMCLYPWSVTVPDLSNLDFSAGYLRWSWIAKHVTPHEL